MRILHVPYSFYPDPAGGTEIYVEALAAWQRAMGCDAAICAPASGPERYEHNGIPVWRLQTSAELSLRDLYGLGDDIAAVAFGAILDDFQPDAVHLHAMTSAISVRLAEQAAERGIPLLFNYHTPTVSCTRGTLLRWGSEICDGKLDRRLCTACTLQANGLPRSVALAVASLPLAASSALSRGELSGGIWTALRMPELIDLRIHAFERMMALVDRVIALCEWTRALLVRNGVSSEKIVLCRQGISWQPTDAAPGVRQRAKSLRAAFLGRLDATKGVHVIVRALRDNPGLPLQLDLFGIRQGEAGNRCAAEIEALISGDPRIRLLPPLQPCDVVPRLRDYDAVLVPSQWLETGPLVVLEAFAAGTPVIGSNLGGIAELVRPEVDGLLVDSPASPASWASALQRICSGGDLLGRLGAGVRPPRRTQQAACELLPVYDEVVAHRMEGTMVCSR